MPVKSHWMCRFVCRIGCLAGDIHVAGDIHLAGDIRRNTVGGYCDIVKNNEHFGDHCNVFDEP